MKKIFVNGRGSELRIAIAENERVVDLLLAKEQEEVGNIYVGRVNKVVQGIQAAFVNLGLEVNGFIQNENLKASKRDTVAGISHMLYEGQKVLVQLVKESSGTKGPRLTDIIELTGKHIVYLPEGGYIAVSKKIEDPTERERLREIGKNHISEKEGIIFRTSSKGSHVEEIENELLYLREVWNTIQKKFECQTEVGLLYSNNNLLDHITRDIPISDGDECIVDDRKIFEELKHRYELYSHTSILLTYYYEKRDLFSTYGIDREIEKALQPTVWLKNGASMTIEETEALTVIDVNTTKFTGKADKEDTIIKVNEFAAKEIARQVRLRNIGGIIIIDFINMKSSNGKKRVLDVLQAELKKDRTYAKIFGFTPLGLLEMTRKQARIPLRSALQSTCRVCGGSGYVSSSETTAASLERALLEYQGMDHEAVWIETSREVAERLRETNRIKKVEQQIQASIFLTENEIGLGYTIRQFGNAEDIKRRVESAKNRH